MTFLLKQVRQYKLSLSMCWKLCAKKPTWVKLRLVTQLSVTTQMIM